MTQPRSTTKIRDLAKDGITLITSPAGSIEESKGRLVDMLVSIIEIATRMDARTGTPDPFDQEAEEEGRTAPHSRDRAMITINPGMRERLLLGPSRGASPARPAGLAVRLPPRVLAWCRRELPGLFPTPCWSCGSKGLVHSLDCEYMLNYINRERQLFGQKPLPRPEKRK